MHAAVIATTVTTPATKPYRLFVNGDDILTGTGNGVPLESLSWDLSGSNGPASLTFDHWDPTRAFTLQAQADVRLWDQVADEDVFAGFLIAREFDPAFAVGRIVRCRATDLSLILDKSIITQIAYPAGLSDRDIIQGLLGTFPHEYLNSSSLYIASTNTNMPAMEFEMQTLRSALEQVATAAAEDDAGDRFIYVDPKVRAVRYYRLRPNSAPYVVVDGTPGGGEKSVSDLKLTHDDSNITNAVYVKGKNAAGSGWFTRSGSIAHYGFRAVTLDIPDSNTATKRNGYARAFLKTRSEPIRRGTFSIVGTTGWRADQTVTITSTNLGLAAEAFDIKRVNVEAISGTTLRHTIEFGALKPGFVRGNGGRVIDRREGVGFGGRS